MTVIDVSTWDKRNVWHNGAGALCVRPGMRRVAAPSGGRRWVGGFSVQNPWTLETWHYVADVSTAGLDLVVRILDDDFVEWQSIKVGVDVIPRGFSYGVVEGEIMIGSPDMPTLWGYVGGALTLATKVDSDNPGTTAIAVPRGLVTSVLNRIVIADGASIYISDPVSVTGGSPRTFVGQNQNQRPGVVFGLHEGAGGQLVCVTSAGVYALDPAAFAVQIVGSNGTDWRLVNRNVATSYESSCNVRGRIYGLTQDGFTLVDTEGGDVARLDDSVYPGQVRRVQSPDWRVSRVYEGDDGPIVVSDGIAHGSTGPLMHWVDTASGVRSWWSHSSAVMRGTLRDPDGDVLVLSEDGVYIIDGNSDGTQACATGSTTEPTAYVFGRLTTDPEDNPIMRRAVWASQASARLAIRGKLQTAQGGGTLATFTADSRSLIINSTNWGSSSVWYQEEPLGNMRWDCMYPTPDLVLELSTDGGLHRFSGSVNVDLSESAKVRTKTRGPG